MLIKFTGARLSDQQQACTMTAFVLFLNVQLEMETELSVSTHHTHTHTHTHKHTHTPVHMHMYGIEHVNIHVHILYMYSVHAGALPHHLENYRQVHKTTICGSAHIQPLTDCSQYMC